MFKKIVVPLDLTERHRAALTAAMELASHNGGEIVLLHVIEVIPGLPVEEEPRFYRRLEKTARNHLKKLGGPLSKRGLTYRDEVLYGQRAPEIARYARAVGADLVVLTAPRLDPKDPAGWGSLSYKVGLLARCPVLLVK